MSNRRSHRFHPRSKLRSASAIPTASTTRREFLATATATAGAAGILGVPSAFAADSRFAMRVGLHNTHTNESIDTVFWDGEGFVAEGLAEIDWLLRDWRTGEVGHVDARLLVTLQRLAKRTRAMGPFHVISGFRSESTNLMLHTKDPEGVPEQSYHMYGMAIDVRLPGFETGDLHAAAISAAFGLGGIGYYPRSDFIHIDTGQTPRIW